LESGAALTIAQAIEHLIGPDTGLRFYAAWWLGRFKVTDQRAVDFLIAALGGKRAPTGGDDAVFGSSDRADAVCSKSGDVSADGG
jgi:PBS lyase HEAT-like repeat